MNRMFGTELHRKDLLERALELLERSRMLLNQNTDPQISDLSLLQEVAISYDSKTKEHFCRIEKA